MPSDTIELWPKVHWPSDDLSTTKSVSARGKQLENVINVYSRKQAAGIQKVPILWHNREPWEWVCDGSLSHPFYSTLYVQKTLSKEK